MRLLLFQCFRAKLAIAYVRLYSTSGGHCNYIEALLLTDKYADARTQTNANVATQPAYTTLESGFESASGTF